MKIDDSVQKSSGAGALRESVAGQYTNPERSATGLTTNRE